MARIGENAHNNPLNQAVDHGASEQGCEKSEGHIPPRVFGLAGGDEGGLETSKGEDEQDHGACPVVTCW